MITDKLDVGMDNNRLFNSFGQWLLVRLFQWVNKVVDLREGILSPLFYKCYFIYKSITDRRQLRQLKKMVLRESCVLDIGANVGFFSIYVAKKTGAKLFAFEPEPVNFRQLQKNLNSAGLDHLIHPFQVALSDQSGEATLFLSDLSPMDHKLINTRSSESIRVPQVALDDWLETELKGCPPISLVKIDVQGAELLVLAGMRQILKANDYPLILVEFSPLDLDSAGFGANDFFASFAALGYQPHGLESGKQKSPASYVGEGAPAYSDILMKRVA